MRVYRIKASRQGSGAQSVTYDFFVVASSFFAAIETGKSVAIRWYGDIGIDSVEECEYITAVEGDLVHTTGKA